MPAKLFNFSGRCLLFFVGLSMLSLGVILIIRANLGASPISTLPYVASLGFPQSIGFFTILMNTGFVAMQICIMRKRFPRIQYLQVMVSILFGFFLDFWMAFVPLFEPASYLHQWLLLFVGTIFMAFGIFAEINANMPMMAGEGIVVALAFVTRKKFGTLKIVFDVSLVASSALLSFLLFDGFLGIGEGTVVSAFFTGIFIKFLESVKQKIGRARALRNQMTVLEDHHAVEQGK